MKSTCSLWVCESPSPSTFECLNHMKLGMYERISWHLCQSQRRTSIMAPISLSVCICMLLGNGLSIHKQQHNCWTCRFLCGPCRIKEESVVCLCIPISVYTFLRPRGIAEDVVFYAIHVKGKWAISPSQNLLSKVDFSSTLPSASRTPK
jgi:hypothetical protein